MNPVGDKVVLKRAETALPDSGGIILSNSSVMLCEVVACGPGMPYGRGEYYSLTVKEGDLVFVPEKAWKDAPQLRVRLGKHDRPVEHRVLHEREILTTITEAEL